MKFKIPLQSEVSTYMRTKRGWPEKFCDYYAERFWNHYTASGWKLSNGNAIKDWKACFNAQWQTLKFKEDIDFLNSVAGTTTFKAPVQKQTNDFEKIDELLGKYLSSPTSVSFEEFGVWYDLMKTHRLLRKFSQEEIIALQTIYGNDNKKCRCAAVQKTFDAYANSGLRIMDIIRMREKLNA